MAFENDPEGHKMALGYAGATFDQTHMVTIEVLREYSFRYSLEEFQGVIDKAINAIPAEHRRMAVVVLDDEGFETSSKLIISYVGPESADVVAKRIKNCEDYVAKTREQDRKTFERLKAKFEPE